MTVFDTPGLLLRDPRAGVEDVTQMHDAGFQWLMVNIGDHPPETWDLIRDRAQRAGMPCGPWLHTRQTDGRFAPDKLEYLVHVADSWRSPLIVNSEKEIDGSGDACTGMIAEEVGNRDAAISMEAWLFNPPSVDWTPVAHLGMLLQIFPEQPNWPSNDPAGCKQHAHDCGIERVYFTYGSYGEFRPEQFELQAPYSIYTADDCGQDYAAWQPTSTGFNPYGNGGNTNGGETTVGIGTAQSCRDAWDNLKASSSLDAWRRDNPGEWQKLQDYWIATAGTGPPAGINSKMGQAHLAVIEARRYAEGSHA